MLRAFVVGYEVAARLGQGELGQTVTKRGIHSTAVFGRLAATVAAACLLRLSPEGVISALGAAATQSIGLVASFGTMSKPLHAGKAAMDGVLSAELAANGFVARPDLLEPGGETLAKALVQDGEVTFPRVAFDGRWEVLQNTFKPFAACNLTHATIETAQKLAARVGDRAIASVVAHVHPSVITLAGLRDPVTPLEGKFSNGYCAALGLLGYSGTKDDFTPDRLSDPLLRAVAARVELKEDPSQTQTSAALVVTFADGETIGATTPLACGNPGNPLSWRQMEQKFEGLVRPVAGDDAEQILEIVRSFGRPGSLDEMSRLISTPRAGLD